MKLQNSTTLGHVASIINAAYKGDPKHPITGINEIHKVENGDLTFVDHPKYYDQALHSAATTILINKDTEPPDGKGLLIADDPFDAYNELVRHFKPYQDEPNGNYCQGRNVRIGKNTTIFPGVYIGNNVSIGDNCMIYPNCAIYAGTEIGNDVIIHANSTIGGDAFYFKARETHHDKLISCGKVVIEDHVEIGGCCTIDKGVSGITRIGEGSKLDGQVHVGHGAVIGKHCILAALVGIGGKSILEDEVKLWGQVGINKDIRIGKGAVVLASSAVSKSIPGNEIYFGAPAVPKGQAYKEAAAIRKLPGWIKEVEQKLKKLLG